MLVLWSDLCVFPAYTAWNHYLTQKNGVKVFPCSGTLSYWSAKPQDSHRIKEISHLPSMAEATCTRQTPGQSKAESWISFSHGLMTTATQHKWLSLICLLCFLIQVDGCNVSEKSLGFLSTWAGSAVTAHAWLQLVLLGLGQRKLDLSQIHRKTELATTDRTSGGLTANITTGQGRKWVTF